MRNIYIVTHTESVHHVQDLGGGWYDTSLTEKGVNQARKIAAALHGEIDSRDVSVYSSDLKRCAEMADIFSQIFDTGVIFDKNLREMNFGDCGGKSKEWRAEHIVPRPMDGNILDHRLFKNAESRRECGQRAHVFINRLINEPGETVIIITHGHFRTFLIMAWLKVPVENMDYCRFEPRSGSVTLLNEDELFGYRNIVYFNRLDYLKG